MLDVEKTQHLIKRYLQNKLKERYNAALLDTIDVSSLAEALQFYYDLCGDFLNLVAIASVDEGTRKLHESEEVVLFELLDETLPFSEENNRVILGPFNRNLARACWLSKKSNFDVTALKALHAQTSNLGIAEKFLNHSLHGQEWLTELDLNRLARIYGIQDQIGITRFNAADIGMILHFHRRKREASADQSEYRIPFLLNHGSMGDVSSQGSHWTQATFIVNPETNRLKIEFKDSLRISTEKKKQIKEVLLAAAGYDEVSQVNGVVQRYRAFSDYHFDEDRDVEITSENLQEDSWSCGYRALKSLVDAPVFDESNNTEFLKLRNLRPEEVSSVNLRVRCYDTLLSSVQLSKEVVERTGQDPSILDESKEHPGKIKPEYLADYLNQIGTVKPNQRQGAVTARALREAQELERQAEKYFKDYQSLLNKKINPPRAAEAKKSLDLDFSEIFDRKDDEKTAKAKIKALINVIISLEDIDTLRLTKLDQVPEAEYFAAEFNRVQGIKNIVSDNESHFLTRQSKIISARNRLAILFKIESNPDDNLWAQIWQKRISNSGLISGDVRYLFGILSLDASGKDRAQINACVRAIGAQYLNELFNFIGSNIEFFEIHEGGFPYAVLEIGSHIRSEHEAQTTPDEYARLNSEYLDSLIEHLKNKAYFPFKSIQLYLNNFSLADFDKLKTLLRLLAAYPEFQSVDLQLTNAEFNGIELSADQYAELVTLFREAELKIAFNVSSGNRAEEVKSNFLKLQNVIANNRREANIKSREGRVLLKPSPVLPEEQRFFSGRGLSSGKRIRPCKDKNFDPQRSLVVEVDLEQQTEQQHQLQTQLQQEVQQEIAVEERAQNEIDSYAGDFSERELISRDVFLLNAKSHSMALLNGAGAQQFGKGKGLSELIFNTASNITDVGFDRAVGELFWKQVIADVIVDYNLPHDLMYLTPSALSKIQSFPQQFWHGFNMDNLPVGFFIQQHQDALVLCYDDTKYVENKNLSPLTVTIKPMSVNVRWRGDLRGFIPNAAKLGYSDDNIATFGGIVTQYGNIVLSAATVATFYAWMNGVNADLAKIIKDTHAWCFKPRGSEEPDYVHLEKENEEYFTDGSNIYALMDILYVEGCQGVKALLDALKFLLDNDPQLYLHFKHSFIDNQTSIRELLTDANLSIIRKLAAMTQAEKEWWKQLVAQHKVIDNRIDLTELYRGFEYFLSKLPKGLSLPLPCPINNPGNMLVSLDRLLSILGKVRPRNIRDQLENLQDLSFDQQGAWYAGRWDGFHYFHPEMKLSPKELDRNFEENILGRTQPSYQVTYEELKKAALSDKVLDFNSMYPVTLFHRYLGGAERLYERYSYYVSLTQKLKDLNLKPGAKAKLLALLALATTGEQASEALDPTPLFNFVQENEAALHDILTQLVQTLDKWEVKPKLDELTALIKLMHASHEMSGEEEQAHEVKQVPSESKVLKIIAPNLSRLTLKALMLWDSNLKRLKANDFLSLYQELENFDKDNIGYLAKIAALVKLPYKREEVESLLATLRELKAKSTYVDGLKVLAAINAVATPPEHLPTLTELRTALEQVENISEPRQVFPRIAAALPRCRFDLASGWEMAPLDLTASMLEKVADLNELLGQYGFEPFDTDEMKGEHAAKYILGRLIEIKECIIQIKGAVFWAVAKGQVYTTIIEGLKGLLLFGVAEAISRFPALLALQESGLFPGPRLSGDYDEIGKDVSAISSYAKNEGELFNSLLELRQKWGEEFNLDFLLNSPRTRELTLKQLKDLLAALKQLDVSYIPVTLLNSIFTDKPRGVVSGDNQEELVKQIIAVLELTEFSLYQRTQLIEIISKAPDPSVAKQLVTCLKNIKDKDAPVLPACFKLLSEYFSTKSDVIIINQINQVLRVKGLDQTVKNIIFERLSENIEVFQELAELLPKRKSKQGPFLTIIAHSCLEREEDLKLFLENRKLMTSLKRLLLNRPQFAAELMRLYEKRPYPKLHKLREFLTLSLSKSKTEAAQAIKDFAERYELDPPGGRPDNLKEQFDYSTIHLRIDQIRDLSRNNDTLYYSQRKELLKKFMYINGIGHKYNLTVPGELPNKSKYQKPVTALRKDEIQMLIRHYRELIKSGKKNRDVELAKLEFIALVREAMYRATGKFPYSTQILSLLNVMLQGGNIFSEVRTGEGKGIITALFAVSKWMEGGAVDVCSSDMELAGRDQADFNEFYEYLGITSALIKAKSQAEAYQQDGINYSDVSEMTLFQEKMQLQQEKLPSKVSCVMDEGDFTTLDNTTQFRYATRLDASHDPHHNPNEWAYPLILEFVSSAAFLEKLCARIIDINDLRKFIYQHPSATKAQKSKFSQFSDTQLDKWIDSAYTASKLVENEDFAVRDSTIVREGQVLPVQVARVKDKKTKRVSADSTFSNGVQQFLHTRLNLEVKADKRKGHRFPIEPEKSYLASKSAKNFIDYYTARGSVLSLTGTVGSPEEIQEMRKNYGFKFYRIPPHKPLARIDYGPIVAWRKRKDFLWMNKETAEEAHFRMILKYIKKAIRQGQPALVICEGVEASQKLHAYLEKMLGESQKETLQLYNGEQLNLREKDVVEKAGLPGMVTVTTAMLGRGTDIVPHYADGSPIEAGLSVIGTYLSSDRDYWQQIGRGGRKGAKGNSRLVLSEAEFPKYKMPLPRNNKQLNQSIEAIRAMLNHESMKERREQQFFADLKDQYFNAYTAACRKMKEDLKIAFSTIRADYREPWKAIEQGCHLLWEQFLNQMDSQWKELLIDLKSQLKENPELGEEDLLKAKVAQLVQFTNKEWEMTRQELETVSTEIFQARLDKAKAQQKAHLPALLEEKVGDTAIPQITIKPFEALAFLEPKEARVREKLPTDLNYTVLDPDDINEAKIYIDRAQGLDPELKKEALEREIAIIYSKLFGNKALAAAHVKLFSKAPQPEESETLIKFKLCLQQILLDYHRTETQAYDGQSKNHLTVLANRLRFAVKAYEMDEELRRATYEIYKKQIQAHKDEGVYVQRLTLEMHLLRELGLIEESADLSQKAIMGRTSEEAWQEIYTYALDQFAHYDSSLFTKSSDRQKELEGLIISINNLGKNSTLSDMEKIAHLIELVNKASHSAAEADLHEDRKIGKWSLFTYRNRFTSRFQEALTKVHDKAMAYFVNQSQVSLDYKNELQTLIDCLQILSKRAALVKVTGNYIIDQFGKDQTLANLLAELNPEDSEQSLKAISLIYDYLSAYRKHLAQVEMDNDSKHAFKRYFNEVHDKLRVFKLSQAHIELTHAGSSLSEPVYMTAESRLRDKIQTALKDLITNDLVSKRHLDLEQYYPLVAQDDENAALLRAVLFEIERCIKSQYPGAYSINFDEAAYSTKTKRLETKLTVQTMIGNKKENMTIELRISSLDLKAPVKDFTLCEWPVIAQLPIVENKKAAGQKAASDSERRLRRKIAARSLTSKSSSKKGQQKATKASKATKTVKLSG